MPTANDTAPSVAHSFILRIPGSAETGRREFRALAETIEEAVIAYEALRDESGEGASTFADGELIEAGSGKRYRIHYNGRTEVLPAEVPFATVRAYRRTGGAVVTVEHHGRSRRYTVSLSRYHALREWTLTKAARRWRTSGAWLRSSVACFIWEARP
jgi:hypothetical protein